MSQYLYAHRFEIFKAKSVERTSFFPFSFTRLSPTLSDANQGGVRITFHSVAANIKIFQQHLTFCIHPQQSIFNWCIHVYP